MPMRPREMVKLLKKHGFVEVSQNGSHLKMLNEKSNRTTIVPIHARDLTVSTQNKILKQAGIKGE